MPRANGMPTSEEALERSRTVRALEAVALATSSEVSIVPAALDLPKLHWYGEAYQPTGWLVKGLLPATGVALISGRWGTGKTFVAMDLAGCVATGHLFANRRVKRTGGVLYVAAEAGGSVSLRLDALVEQKLRKQPDLFEARLPLVWTTSCSPLAGGEGSAEIKAVAAGAASELRDRYQVELALIIVDTLAAAAGFGDENNAAEAQQVMNVLHDLSGVTGALVVAVDHFGKDENKGTRGSSAKESSADAVLALQGDGAMTVRKLRDGSSGFPIPFDLELVEMGRDEDGDPVTSRIVQWLDSRPPKPGKGKTSKDAAALQQAIADLGSLPLPRDKLRDAFARVFAGAESGRRMAFKRAIEQLNLVEKDGVLDHRPSPI